MSDQWEGSSYSASPGWIDDRNEIHRRLNDQKDLNESQGRLNEALVEHNRHQKGWTRVFFWTLVIVLGSMALNSCANWHRDNRVDNQQRQLWELQCQVYELKHPGSSCTVGTLKEGELRA